MKFTRQELEEACENVIHDCCEDVDRVMFYAKIFLAAIVSGRGNETVIEKKEEVIKKLITKNTNIEFEG